MSGGVSQREGQYRDITRESWVETEWEGVLILFHAVKRHFSPAKKVEKN